MFFYYLLQKRIKQKKANFGTKFNTICLTIVFFFFNEENIALTVIIEKEMEIY